MQGFTPAIMKKPSRRCPFSAAFDAWITVFYAVWISYCYTYIVFPYVAHNHIFWGILLCSLEWNHGVGGKSHKELGCNGTISTIECEGNVIMLSWACVWDCCCFFLFANKWIDRLLLDPRTGCLIDDLPNNISEVWIIGQPATFNQVKWLGRWREADKHLNSLQFSRVETPFLQLP